MRTSLIIILLFMSSLSVAAQSDTLNKIEIIKFLCAGPVKLNEPILSSDSGNYITGQLATEQISIKNLNPKPGKEILISKQQKLEWKEITLNNELPIRDEGYDNLKLFYLAVYLQSNRFVKTELEISSSSAFKIYLDNHEIGDKKTIQKTLLDDPIIIPEEVNKKIQIETGVHLLLIKVLSYWSDPATILSHVKLKCAEYEDKNSINISTASNNFYSIKNLLDDPKLGNISISQNGKLAAVTISQIKDGTDNRESWIEIYNTESGKRTHSFNGGMKLPAISWSPKENVFAYSITEKELTTIWIADILNASSFRLVENIKDFSSFSWSPDGSYLIYSVTEKEEDNKSGMKIFRGLQDRWPWARNKSRLFLVEYPSGFNQQLTSDETSSSLSSISGDGNKIILSSTVYDYSDRPYSFTTYFILNRQSMKVDTIKTLNWARSVQFSPDGKNLVILGGPSMFGGRGKNLPDSLIPNEYDVQAYLYNFETKSGDCISRDFNPSISSASWSELNNSVYFNTTDKTFQTLYRYDLKEKLFHKINLSVEVLDDIEFAQNNLSAVYKGSGAVEPEKLYFINLKTNKSKLLLDLNENIFSDIKLGKVEDFDFTNSRGDKIDGLVYFPPDFDPDNKYPCIVYYYGGTSPTEQTFEGRYPRNLWTANGYIVYALQPSGAIGYGQKFSAYHVNDWGKLTAEEIIQGTKLFLESHPYVDEKRVGCIGASYGGFMTMNLLTKTNIFAAGISHAGISSLSSYWGEGYWGYQYSAVATANSFPWNRKDIYVDDSPLFNADKINTPLLLLHGAADTNVPPGESTQMYTALKLLGKDVEYIQVEGQDHHILDYKKRIQWTKTILAWFDYKLKDQPQWWNELYPDKSNEQK